MTRSLADDCFALPPGVTWTRVDEALGRLRAVLHPVTDTERVPLGAASLRTLAEPVHARRANPAAANAAVDGYAFAAATLPVDGVMALVAGRAAAGVPLGAVVPPGRAVRILTGAALPDGVDTVVLQEDVVRRDDAIVVPGEPRAGANTRAAGEDVGAGEALFPAGHRLRPQDLALLAATGVAEVAVFRRLRVGVLSTGDEIRPVGSAAAPHQVYDANRPMLLALAAGWGYDPLDLGHVPDERETLRGRFDEGARVADVILTTGGASAGDEDHVSALLEQGGSLAVWRIAMKPGRPLALAVWDGVPVFALPGNPVAAFVCALVFAAPAMRVLGGSAWRVEQGVLVPAAFTKRKKAGRREYLRARLVEGRAEIFRSEGSGLISGLSWSQGLVELPEEALTVDPGDPVRYLAYEGFY